MNYADKERLISALYKLLNDEYAEVYQKMSHHEISHQQYEKLLFPPDAITKISAVVRKFDGGNYND